MTKLLNKYTADDEVWYLLVWYRRILYFCEIIECSVYCLVRFEDKEKMKMQYLGFISMQERNFEIFVQCNDNYSIYLNA